MPPRLLSRLPLQLLYGAEVDERLVLRRIGGDSVLVFRDRAVEVLQASERIASEDLCPGVLRVTFQSLVGARLRILEAARDEQPLSRLDLRVGVVGQKIRGPDVLLDRVICIVGAHIGIGKLQVRVAKLGVNLQRAPEFDDRLRDLALLEVCAPLLDVFLGSVFLAAAATDGTDQPYHQERTWAHKLQIGR